MSETARALGLPGAIQWGGETLTVERVTFELEGYFERWLETRVFEAVARNRAALGAEGFREALRVAEQDVAAGVYAWTGDGARKAAWSPEGFKELSFLCVARHNPGWTRERHAELLADQNKYEELIRLIHRISDPLPNGSAPAAPAAGATT